MNCPFMPPRSRPVLPLVLILAAAPLAARSDEKKRTTDEIAPAGKSAAPESKPLVEAPRSSSTAARQPVKVKLDGEELYAVGFEQLSAFPYTVVDAGTGASPEEIEAAKRRDQIPPWIRIYHQKRVLLTGYMMPLQIEQGRARKFFLMKDVTTCCYGAVPSMNDYVVVTMKGDGVVAVPDVPVQLVGVLQIEEKYEAGYLTALLSMDGEKFLGAPRK